MIRLRPSLGWPTRRLLWMIWLIVLRLLFLGIGRSRRGYLLSCWEGRRRIRLWRIGNLDRRSISVLWGIHRQLNLSFYSRYTKLHQGVSTLVEEDPRLWVWLLLLKKIHRLRNLCWRVEHLYWVTMVSVVSTNLTRWIPIHVQFYSRWCSSKRFP